MVLALRDGPIGEKLRTAGIPTYILSEKGFDVAALYSLRAAIRRFRPDILHTHLFRATLLGRLAAGGENHPVLISSIHGAESPWYHRLERRMAQLSARLIFPSRSLQEWYHTTIRPLPPHRSLVMYPGALVQCDPAGASSPGIPHLGSLSRLHPVKGLDTLLKACARLRDIDCPFRLTIGGDGREKSHLETLVDELRLRPQVRFAGSITETTRFFTDLDIFAAPSHQEAFGLTACEAMAHGLPVIAGRVGGLQELIADGSTGFLVEPGNVDALFHRLKWVLTHLFEAQRIGKNAQNSVRYEFPRERWLESHEELYRQWTPRPRSLHVAISSRERGGGENMAVALASAMAQRGWRISALCGGQPLRDVLSAAGIPTRTASLKLGGLFFAVRLAAILNRSGLTAVHAHLNRAALIAGVLGKVLRIPVLGHVHGLNRSLYYRRCSRLVAVSRAVQTHLIEQGIPANRIILMPNAIAQPVRRTPRSPGPPWHLAIVAKLHPNKGHAWALQAMAERLSDLPDFRLFLFGDGCERERLQNAFSGGPLGSRLEFMGFQPNLDTFFPRLHALILPSLGEGIPLSLLEGMRWGLPSVVTNVGGIPEVIRDGENGFLVSPGASGTFIDRLQRLLQPSTWKTMSERSYELFEKLNSFPGLIDQLEQTVMTLSVPAS
jgi:glycosyltransferase involved in cell wall biosynthesis